MTSLITKKEDKAMSKRITLGSGKLYLIPYAETIPEVETICTDENLLGLIKGGATLEPRRS